MYIPNRERANRSPHLAYTLEAVTARLVQDLKELLAHAHDHVLTYDALMKVCPDPEKYPDGQAFSRMRKKVLARLQADTGIDWTVREVSYGVHLKPRNGKAEILLNKGILSAFQLQDSNGSRVQHSLVFIEQYPTHVKQAKVIAAQIMKVVAASINLAKMTKAPFEYNPWYALDEVLYHLPASVAEADA